MAKRVHLTFSGENYDRTCELIVKNSPLLGSDEVWVYDDKFLVEQDFYHVNKYWFDLQPSRAISWYIWKPFIVMHAMRKLQDGDLLLFSDADCFPIASLDPLYKVADRDGIMLFQVSGHKGNNRAWVKRDMCIVMDCDDEKKYLDVDAGVARFMLFKVGHWLSHQLVAEWLSYTLNPKANTFRPSVLGAERAGFIENRCEQGVLSLLAHKYGLKLWREADQSGEGHVNDREVYGQTFCQVNTPKYLNVTAPILGSRFFNIDVRHSSR